MFIFFFFFQAEDGIRDIGVTGVQTCALPIYWRHWGLVFAIMAYFANIWPGWATSSATLVTYLVGGSVVPIAIGMLLLIGITLTLAPVVYQALEKIEFFKVAAEIGRAHV